MSNLYSFLLLPQNYVAEEILIGSIIINPSLIILVEQVLKPNHFFIESHKIVYRSLITIQKSSHIDPVELTYCLKKTKMLEKVGGIRIITILIKQGQIFNFSNNTNFYVQEIIKVIHYNYYRRLIIQYGHNIIKLGHNREFSNSLLTHKTTEYLNYLNSLVNPKNIDNLDELIGVVINNIKTLNTGTNHNTIYSGFKNLDILTNGLPDGDLIVIAGRPSMGKTSFVMNIIYHLLTYFKTQVCLFSLEMTGVQILHKLISIGSGVSVQNIIFRTISTKRWEIIQKICNDILSAKLYINDNPNISIDEIQNITENNINTQVIIIDYLQLINEKSFNLENRNQELSYITRKLKILAQTLKVPVIILSQLNRSIEKRINKQPLLSDLKESGCVSSCIFLDHKNTYKNNIHIRTVNKNIHIFNILFFSNIRKEYNPYLHIQNYTKKIYTFSQYLFQSLFQTKKHLLLTNNHSYLNYRQWTKKNELQEDNLIAQLHTLKYIKYYNIVEKVYIQKITFWNYGIVYDITKYQYCNFICQALILHNSIEQDADIVMMLYKSNIQDNDLNSPKLKVVDIIVSKNRNGPIGEFKLCFNAVNTLFTDINPGESFADLEDYI